jgi:hypothetical protein
MMSLAKAPSKRSGEAGRKEGDRLGWSRSEAPGRPVLLAALGCARVYNEDK